MKPLAKPVLSVLKGSVQLSTEFREKLPIVPVTSIAVQDLGDRTLHVLDVPIAGKQKHP